MNYLKTNEKLTPITGPQEIRNADEIEMSSGVAGSDAKTFGFGQIGRKLYFMLNKRKGQTIPSYSCALYAECTDENTLLRCFERAKEIVAGAKEAGEQAEFVYTLSPHRI